MTFREELYNRITSADLGNKEEVTILVQSLASDLIRYHDVSMEQEDKLQEIMTAKDYYEWSKEMARKMFIRDMESMPDSDFKDFVFEHLDEVFMEEES